MKKQLTSFVLAGMMMLGFAAFGQESAPTKLGHINADQLLQMMPETKQAQADIEAYRNQLEKDLSDMEAELQAKIQSFRENEKMMTTLSRETKTREIQDLQARIQEYSMQAQEDFGSKQEELLTPIIEKASAAVQKVAKDNGFTYILDSSESKAVVIFAENGIDIMDLVKAELGIQ
jgi:outer membrane protein